MKRWTIHYIVKWHGAQQDATKKTHRKRSSNSTLQLLSAQSRDLAS
jgi:hypothetical protein